MNDKRHERAQAQIETGAAEAPPPGEQSIDVDDLRVTLEAACAERSTLSVEQRDGLTLVHVDLPAGAAGEYTIVLRQPCIDIHRSWVGNVDCWRGSELTSIALNYSFESAANSSMPVICNFNREGLNRGVIGLLDHSPVTHINQRAEIDTPPMQWLRARFTRTLGEQARRETLVIARRREHYVQAVRKWLRFCRDAMEVSVLPAPDWARLPVWCTWYSHLYGLTQGDVESHIPLLKDLGFETVLIDASWFKPQNIGINRASGDYEPFTELMPDLQALSRRLHDAGLRLMLWCAPRFLGEAARCRQQMAQYCTLEGGKRTEHLCVFCDESVAFVNQMMKRLMRDYELDGLKIDFMDRIQQRCDDPNHDHGDGDFGAAINRFAAAARDGIVALNPDAAIEYRIRYSTVCNLANANCHRGNDAPYDADYIRRENLFLRLFADHPAAAWSDYAYWHADESSENVGAMLGQQILSGGVPTVSVNLESLSKAHRNVLRDWLRFYRDHADALARADLRVHSADAAMSVSSFHHGRTAYVLLAGQHIPTKLDLGGDVDDTWLLNCSAEPAGTMTVGDQAHAVSGRDLQRLPIRPAH